MIDLKKLSGIELQNLLRSFKCGTEPSGGVLWNDAMEEARRRGIPLLKELGYPTIKKEILRNFHTGEEDTLFNIVTDDGDFIGPDKYADFTEALADEVPHILRDWKLAAGPNLEKKKEKAKEMVREAISEGNKSLVQFV